MVDDKVLRQLQLTMLETRNVFDAFCRKHDIKYTLYAGSLLGAVRPDGYILQNKDWQSFSKIRKDHTTFLQKEREMGKYHGNIC